MAEVPSGPAEVQEAFPRSRHFPLSSCSNQKARDMTATIILLAMLCINLGIHLAKHKEPREDRYNFWVALFAFAVQVTLYYFAGLFENFK